MGERFRQLANDAIPFSPAEEAEPYDAALAAADELAEAVEPLLWSDYAPGDPMDLLIAAYNRYRAARQEAE